MGARMILESGDFDNYTNKKIEFDFANDTIHADEFRCKNLYYPSKYWHTPTYAEMNYILNTRTNASNLRGLGRVNVNGTYINGCFLLPDDFVAPEGITFNPTIADYTTNSYTLEQFRKLEDIGVVFMCKTGDRGGTSVRTPNKVNHTRYWITGVYNALHYVGNLLFFLNENTSIGHSIRLARSSSKGNFSTSSTTKIEFSPANLQYHCTKHIWRFAKNQYDYIGQENENISDTYDGWIDLFGYGTSGVNYSPILNSTNIADYAIGDISNTDNDWGVNRILMN